MKIRHRDGSSMYLRGVSLLAVLMLMYMSQARDALTRSQLLSKSPQPPNEGFFFTPEEDLKMPDYGHMITSKSHTAFVNTILNAGNPPNRNRKCW